MGLAETRCLEGDSCSSRAIHSLRLDQLRPYGEGHVELGAAPLGSIGASSSSILLKKEEEWHQHECCELENREVEYS